MSEFVIIAACIVVALVVMQAYVRRGLSARIKNVVDSNLGEQFDPMEGNYSQTFFQTGETVSETRLVQKDKPTGVNVGDPGDKDDTAWYLVSFQVSGEEGISYDLDGDGTEEVMIEPDSGRDPMKTITFTVSETEWE